MARFIYGLMAFGAFMALFGFLALYPVIRSM